MTRKRPARLGALALILGLAAPIMARAADPITIGFGMALTGGLAAGGKSALLAMQIWQEQINAKGGLMGRPVKLIYYDDQSNPATVPALYTKLLDVDKVDFIVSGYGTNQIAPAMPIAGAPRTCKRRIASKTSSGVRQSIIRTSPGSVVWSMIRRQPSSPPTHSTARSFVRKAVPPHRETRDIKSPGRPPGQLAAVERRAAGSYNAGAKVPDAERTEH